MNSSLNLTISKSGFPIETLLVDMDGTLLDLHFDDYFWQSYLPKCYLEKHNRDIYTLFSSIKEGLESGKGELHWYCPEYWSNILNLDIMLLKAEIKELISFRKGAVDFLQACKNNQKNMVLVTNAHPKVIALKNNVVPFLHYFDCVVSSHDVGVPKESSHFWYKLREMFALNWEKCAFIDDSLPILCTANACGIKNLFYVAQPNSKKIRKNSSEFCLLHHFADIIMP